MDAHSILNIKASLHIDLFGSAKTGLYSINGRITIWQMALTIKVH